MAEPIVVDVRLGMTRPALDVLREARHAYIALKDGETACLGLEIGSPGPPGAETTLLDVLVIKGVVQAGAPAPPLSLPGHGIRPGFRSGAMPHPGETIRAEWQAHDFALVVEGRTPADPLLRVHFGETTLRRGASRA